VALPGNATAATITEFSQGIPPGAKPAWIARGADGNLWFTQRGVRAIGRITLEGNVTEFSEGLTGGAYGIALGSDDNIWFTEPAGRVGRITPAGVVTEFTEGITQTGAGLYQMAAGPDGHLWFTETAGRIARTALDGAVTEFPGWGATGIAGGPDGNVWFTSSTGVGRMTPAGEVTGFFSEGLSAGAFPYAITTGPDGNLWFTESVGERTMIGRITPTGEVTEFSEGITPRSSVGGITVGADGNLWFAEPGSDRIGRMTPAGKVTEFSRGITPGSQPFGITAGPDGNIWFTEVMGNRIGRLVLEPPRVSLGAPSAIGATSATVAGTVDPRGTATAVRVEFGPTAAYGRSVALAEASGADPLPVSGSLTGLVPATTYHYRLIASSDDGTARSDDATFTTTAAPGVPPQRPARARPRLSGLRISPRRAVPRAPGVLGAPALVTVTASAPGRLRLVAERMAPGQREGLACVAPTPGVARAVVPPCTRYLKGTRLARPVRAGQVVVAFSGMSGGRALPAGTYRLTLTLTSRAGAVSAPVRGRLSVAGA
jgi:virginiamycin B lyase